ncbi:MAG: hypothetical protein KJO77_06825 [Bacteroidia bacterium]|nr:hypothetical protein [Bacteroidia bacterium]NND50959.1 hypothetical protein [Flavobacteriaceae bacterium]
MLALLTPSAVKLAHLFENHEHVVCDNPSTSHFHELDWDCEFYKFKHNNQVKISLNNFDLFANKSNAEMLDSNYEFISQFQQTQTCLRGPPSLV